MEKIKFNCKFEVGDWVKVKKISNLNPNWILHQIGIVVENPNNTTTMFDYKVIIQPTEEIIKRSQELDLTHAIPTDGFDFCFDENQLCFATDILKEINDCL